MSTDQLTESESLEDSIMRLNLKNMRAWAEQSLFDFNSKREMIYSPQCELVLVGDCRVDDPDPDDERLAYFWGNHRRSLFILVPEGEVDVDQIESRHEVRMAAAAFSLTRFEDINPRELVFPENVAQDATEEENEERRRAKEAERQEAERRECLRQPGGKPGNIKK